MKKQPTAKKRRQRRFVSQSLPPFFIAILVLFFRQAQVICLCLVRLFAWPLSLCWLSSGRFAASGCVSIRGESSLLGVRSGVGFSFVSRLRRRYSPENSFLFTNYRRRRNVHLLRLGRFFLAARFAAGFTFGRRCRLLFLLRGWRRRLLAFRPRSPRLCVPSVELPILSSLAFRRWGYRHLCLFARSAVSKDLCVL